MTTMKQEDWPRYYPGKEVGPAFSPDLPKRLPPGVSVSACQSVTTLTPWQAGKVDPYLP
jgi:hypothetical protein